MSEREYSEKIVKIKLNASKKVNKVVDNFSKMQKMKADSLKKTEEMLASAIKDLEKIEQDIAKSKDIAPESKQRLSSEIITTRQQIKQRYEEVKTRISAAVIP